MNSEVCVIVVTYNSTAVLARFLTSVPAGVRTIVVDNASGDDVAKTAAKHGAELIALEENIGYGAACNKGAQATDAEFLVFANPDVQFAAGAIGAFIKAAKKYPNAAFNPRIYAGRRRLIRKSSRLLPEAPHWVDIAASDADYVVPVLSGACIFVRRKHFEGVGRFDPEIFLFHEDDDLSVRLRKAGIELRLASEAVVHHAAGRSTVRSPRTGRIKGGAMARSLLHVMKKHGLPLDVTWEYRKAMMRLVWPHVFLVPSRWAKHREFARELRRSLDKLSDPVR